MREDGIIKILNGITSFSEVRKVVDLNIRNITRLQESRSDDASGIDTTAMNPRALFTNKSIELSTLIDSLKKLEHEQMINPEKDISAEIKKTEMTILELLKHSRAEEVFDEKENFAKTHETFKRITEDLAELHQHAEQNPDIDMSQKLRRIREEIEHHDTQKA